MTHATNSAPTHARHKPSDTVRLSDADTGRLIDPNYVGDDRDMRTMNAGLWLARENSASKLAAYLACRRGVVAPDRRRREGSSCFRARDFHAHTSGPDMRDGRYGTLGGRQQLRVHDTDRPASLRPP